MKSRFLLVRTLIVLGVTQLIGWGTVSLVAIVGRQMADDLQMDVAAVFAGNSVLYVVMGLCAPFLARPFVRLGARRVMIVGTVIAIAGFVALALAPRSGELSLRVGYPGHERGRHIDHPSLHSAQRGLRPKCQKRDRAR